jgi:hypothetical protein
MGIDTPPHESRSGLQPAMEPARGRARPEDRTQKVVLSRQPTSYELRYLGYDCSERISHDY